MGTVVVRDAGELLELPVGGGQGQAFDEVTGHDPAIYSIRVST
jgi:hypothetical protein